MGEANSMTLEDQIAKFDPTNPDSLAALEKAAKGESDISTDSGNAAKTVATESSSEETAKQDEKKADDAPAEGAPSDAQAQVVQAKDGKHVIPYAVLESEREARKKLEQEMAELKTSQTASAPFIPRYHAEIPADLQDRIKGLDAEQDDLRTKFKNGELEAELLYAEMVRIGEQKMLLMLDQVKDQISQEQSQQYDRQLWEHTVSNFLSSVKESEGMDYGASPILNAALDHAVKSLASNPENADKDSRWFLSQAHQQVKGAFSSPSQTSTQPTQPKATDLKAQADAKLKGQPAPVPTTLSDIPGGAPPAQSDIETLENASSVALGNKFMSMTSDQIQSYLARMVA